jgi:hypothetical protein
MRYAILGLVLVGQLAGQMARPGGGSGNRVPVLQTAERDRLLLMREEEKMAGDVYRFLAEKWKLRVFSNIAESEDRHFEAVGRLIDRYQLTDPTIGLGPDVYRSTVITALYQQLIAKGQVSLQDALEVGVMIEKLDIQDLVTGVLETKQSDIKRVYTNLLNASFSHLESFETTLETLVAGTR